MRVRGNRVASSASGSRAMKQAALAAIAAVVLSSCGEPTDHAAPTSAHGTTASSTVGLKGDIIGGPYGKLLAGSADLGPDTGGVVQVTAALPDPSAAQALTDWARGKGLNRAVGAGPELGLRSRLPRRSALPSHVWTCAIIAAPRARILTRRRSRRLPPLLREHVTALASPTTTPSGSVAAGP